MRTRKIVWALTSLVLAALLVGAKSIIEMNQAALAGTTNGQPAAFYGH